ncbi:putative bifunctional diguanylate cyclase/phosphodiesterase [Roseibium aggregatum]|uniref:EAL domain-containing protein n=1 Tax=Roseibium aggregatum TaxID=187304 RepID=A0A939ELA8_9HYPH|nr:EAL domain-containing protein [Roseibium aggregatum]MBN9673660.1 EAL domain-containing protein [Roseibium aggregatum]
MAGFLAGGPMYVLIFFLGAVIALVSQGFLARGRMPRPVPNEPGFEFGNDAAILRLVVEHAHEGLVMQDVYGLIQWSNPAYSRITGYSAEEIRGRRPQEFILPPENKMPADEVQAFRYDLEKVASGSEELILNRRKNGELFWNQLTFAVVEGNSLDDAKIILICRDVTSQVEHMKDLEEARNRLKHQAEHDDLTGVANRGRFESYLQERIAASENDGGPFGIIHFDLDHFKEINDTHGHGAGDAVLRNTAQVLKATLGDKGLVARIGGDEFLAVLPEPRGEVELEAAARRVLAGLEKPVMVDRQAIRVSASIGLLLVDGRKASASEAINRADIALYEAKKAGRGQIAWYTDLVGAAHRHRRMVMARLDQDLEQGNLSLMMEPEYCFKRQAVTGFEVSANWLHPSEGLVDPIEMLSSQEDTMRIAAIERFAMERGFAEVGRLRNEVGVPFTLSVNLSEASLKEQGAPDRLKALCNEAGFAAQDVIVELEEKIVRFNETSGLKAALEHLSACGFQVALDKFGSGHGGGSQLIYMNADVLKMSHQLTEGLETEEIKKQVVQSVIHLARSLGVEVSAAGVDRPGQVEILKDFGCDRVQGRALGGQMSPREAEIHVRGFGMQPELQ